MESPCSSSSPLHIQHRCRFVLALSRHFWLSQVRISGLLDWIGKHFAKRKGVRLVAGEIKLRKTTSGPLVGSNERATSWLHFRLDSRLASLCKDELPI
jgi:hypothetical protein